MVSTKLFTIYFLILVFFSFFSGLFELSAEEEEFNNQIIIRESLFTNDIKNKILVNTGLDSFVFFKVTANILSLPFIILESLLFIISIITIGFVSLPSTLQVLFFAPMGVIIVMDYIIPVIRGN